MKINFFVILYTLKIGAAINILMQTLNDGVLKNFKKKFLFFKLLIFCINI